MTVQILDTTLRDGSYVIDFQFDADDTAVLVAELSRANVPYIEIGHGLGLGAGRRPEMKAAVSDHEYLSASATVAGGSRWGVFFIPGIGELEDIRRAAECGMSFIRIGTDITDVTRARDYVELARELELEVFCNFMKTYAVEPHVTADMARLAVSMGAHHVCVVDSAGGMLPQEVSAHVRAIKDALDISVGFHGHNNLGLAIANGLAAVDAGAAIIDTSIRGMGRSAGNASTEIFALALRRAGYQVDIDVHHLLDTAERIVDPLLRSYQQMDSVGVISGYAQFHSSFTEKVADVAEQFDVDIRDLIVELTKVNRLAAPDELLQTLARELAAKSKKEVDRNDIELPRSASGSIVRTESPLDEALVRCQGLSRKWKKPGVLNVVCSDSYESSGSVHSTEVSPYIFEGKQYVVASVIVYSETQLRDAISRSRGLVDYVMVDQDRLDGDIVSLHDLQDTPKVLLYSDIELWSRAAVRMTRAVMDANGLTGVLVLGDSLLSQLIVNHLRLYANDVVSVHPSDEMPSSLSKIVLLCSVPDERFLKNLSETTILDVRLNSLDAGQVESLLERSNQILRLEMHRELHAEIQAQVESSERYSESHATSDILGIRVIANGLVGQAGDIVIDSISNPTKIIGVADGRGLLRPLEAYTSEDFNRIHQVREYVSSVSRRP